jgi:urocanate hydratase
LTVDTYGRWLPKGNEANVDPLDRTSNTNFTVDVVTEMASSGRKNSGGYIPAEVGGNRSGNKTGKKELDRKLNNYKMLILLMENVEPASGVEPPTC